MTKVTPDLLREFAGYVLQGKVKWVKTSQKGKKQRSFYLDYEIDDVPENNSKMKYTHIAGEILEAADALEKGSLRSLLIAGSSKEGIAILVATTEVST